MENFSRSPSTSSPSPRATWKWDLIGFIRSRCISSSISLFTAGSILYTGVFFFCKKKVTLELIRVKEETPFNKSAFYFLEKLFVIFYRHVSYFPTPKNSHIWALSVLFTKLPTHKPCLVLSWFENNPSKANNYNWVQAFFSWTMTQVCVCRIKAELFVQICAIIGPTSAQMQKNQKYPKFKSNWIKCTP